MDIQQLLSYELSPLVWALCGATLLLAAFVAAFFIPALARVSRRVRRDNAAPLPEAGYPDVSVIVYANNNGDSIEELLNDIFGQDYPAETEIIVVTDGSFDETERIVGRMQLAHTNLYLTFTPENSRNLSRRKLSVTLGVKAARFDTVVLTTANSRIRSDKWLRHMARHFIAGKQVVTGYAAYDPDDDTEGAFRSRAFDTVWEAVGWLSPGILSHPRRGIASNLAYTRQIFFDNKGFSRSLNLNYGDDDIFISEIATADNSVVEIATDAQVTVNDSDPAQMHRINKMRREFTRSITGGFFRRWMALAAWTLWLMTGAAVAAGLLGWPSALPAAFGAVCVIATWIWLSLAWRRTARALGARPLTLTIVPLMMVHPIYELRYRYKTWKNRRRNYTWSN